MRELMPEEIERGEFIEALLAGNVDEENAPKSYKQFMELDDEHTAVAIQLLMMSKVVNGERATMFHLDAIMNDIHTLQVTGASEREKERYVNEFIGTHILGY